MFAMHKTPTFTQFFGHLGCSLKMEAKITEKFDHYLDTLAKLDEFMTQFCNDVIRIWNDHSSL